MDRLDAMALFVAAVDEGSLAAAARRHGRSPAAATRAIALLEQQAGEALMLRSTRRLGLTAAGEHHLAIWRDVLARLDAAASATVGTELHGSIAVTAPELLGQMKVMPLVESFLDRHPQVSARVLLVNRIVDLVGEGVDVAVRLASLPGSTLTATRVGQVRQWLCAAPAYLAGAAPLETVSDLDRHDCIGLNAASDGELWSFDPRGQRRRAVRVRTRLSVSNAAAAIDAALRGGGIVCVRSYQVAGHVAAGRLVRLLPEAEIAPIPAHLVFPAERARSGVVRAFLDHAAPALRRELID